MLLFDCHTHNALAPYPSLINCFVDSPIPITENYLSLSIHPLFLEEGREETLLQQLKNHLQSNPKIIAIGEVGLDKRSPYPLDKQIEFLEQVIRIAENRHLPLLFHCVNAYNELIHLRKEHPLLPWILHGFRKKEVFAHQLNAYGFRFSFGHRAEYSTSFLRELPFFFLETDEENTSLLQTYTRFAQILSMTVEELSVQMLRNAEKVFGKKFLQ